MDPAARQKNGSRWRPVRLRFNRRDFLMPVIGEIPILTTLTFIEAPNFAYLGYSRLFPHHFVVQRDGGGCLS